MCFLRHCGEYMSLSGCHIMLYTFVCVFGEVVPLTGYHNSSTLNLYLYKEDPVRVCHPFDLQWNKILTQNVCI